MSVVAEFCRNLAREPPFSLGKGNKRAPDYLLVLTLKNKGWSSPDLQKEVWSSRPASKKAKTNPLLHVQNKTKKASSKLLLVREESFFLEESSPLPLGKAPLILEKSEETSLLAREDRAPKISTATHKVSASSSKTRGELPAVFTRIKTSSFSS